jgi:protein-L-isoaspartate(D-aspartate) O-methyltransferase
MIEQATLAPDFAGMRQAMVESQLRTNAVDDPRVIAAMLRIPREDYLPEEAARLAYRDTPVRLTHDREANLPMSTGRLLTAAAVAPSDSVLLIGAAGGYAAAVLAEVAARVTAVESDPALAASARTALAGNTKVMLVEGPLEAGAPENAPYDVLVVDGAVEHMPDALVAQLKPGGRMVSGIVDRGVTRLAAGVRTQGGFGLRPFADVYCVPLPGFSNPKPFKF